jgi:hypothetical protein
MKKTYLMLGLFSLCLGALTLTGCPSPSNSPSAPVTVYVLITATYTPTVTPTSTSTGTPTATPTATPEPPVINAIPPQTVSDSGSPLQITLSATDPYANSVAFSILTQAAHGIAGITGNTCTYTPNPSYTGPDAFTFKCTDSVTNAFASEAVTLTVVP